MLIIKPFGRLGNNIIQIINCVKENIYCHKHKNISLKLLKNFQIKIFQNFPEYLEFDFLLKNCQDITDIFWDTKTNITNEQMINIIDLYIKPYINYNIDFDTGINFDTDLIIHMRSGDIFNINFPLNQYIQPPISFYIKIIQENTFKNIYILSENYQINPIIPELLKKFNNIKFLSNDIYTDFLIMLNSSYFVNSNTTLSYVVNSISKKKKKIFLSSWTIGIDNNEYIHYYYNEYYLHSNKTHDEKIQRLLTY
jgi:hypothetical protein